MLKGLACTLESAGKLSIQISDPQPKPVKSGSQALALVFSENLPGIVLTWGQV